MDNKLWLTNVTKVIVNLKIVQGGVKKYVNLSESLYGEKENEKVNFKRFYWTFYHTGSSRPFWKIEIVR